MLLPSAAASVSLGSRNAIRVQTIANEKKLAGSSVERFWPVLLPAYPSERHGDMNVDAMVASANGVQLPRWHARTNGRLPFRPAHLEFGAS
jgi:hypothetical protein